MQHSARLTQIRAFQVHARDPPEHIRHTHVHGRGRVRLGVKYSIKSPLGVPASVSLVVSLVHGRKQARNLKNKILLKSVF